MLRFILLSILLTIVIRAVSSVWAGIIRGMQDSGAPSQAGARGAGSSGVAQRGVQMVRDPICGTFVVPDAAVALSNPSGERVYFCSADCRDQYRATHRSASPAHGRTA
jgi:YHS domain-containing protein